MVGAGALVGLLACLASLVLIGETVNGELEGLARLAIVLPAGIFVTWWLLVPGIRLDRDEVPPSDEEHAAAERIQHIEEAFADAPFVMGRRARRVVDEPTAALAEMYRGSIVRRPQTSGLTPSEYGVRRPQGVDEGTPRASGGRD